MSSAMTVKVCMLSLFCENNMILSLSCLSAWFSVCPPVCHSLFYYWCLCLFVSFSITHSLSACLSLFVLSLSLWLLICLNVSLSLYLCIRLSVLLSPCVRLSRWTLLCSLSLFSLSFTVCPTVCLSVFLSVSCSVHLSVSQSVCLSLLFKPIIHLHRQIGHFPYIMWHYCQ